MESTGARFVKNTSAQLLNQALLVISSFAITIPLARLWGAESFGRYSFAIAFTGLFSFSFDWGLNWLLTREVARNKQNVAKYLNNALGLTSVLSSVTLVVVTVLVSALDYPSEITLATYLAGIWTLLEVVASLLVKGAFYAFERMEYETPPLLAEKVFAVVAGLAVVATRSGLIALMLVLVASRAIKLAVCIAIYTKRIAPLGLEFDGQFWQALAKSAFPFGLNLAFGLVYSKIDITMLSLLRGDEAEIGFYRAALTASMYLPLVGAALVGSWFPMLSDLYQSERESFILNYHRAVRLVFAVGLPMALGLCLLGDRLVMSVYGESFLPSVVSLRILSVSVLLKFIHGALAMVLTSSNQQGLRTSIIAFAALGNIAMNYLLIPWKGFVGASIAAALTDGLILVTSYSQVSRQLGRLPILAATTRPVLSAIAMGLYVLVLRRAPLVVLIPSATAIYVVVLYVLGGLPRDELSRLRAVLTASWFNRVAE